MMRQCGDCTLCCRLLPVQELAKKANTRCDHQRASGCAIYDRRPFSCMLWNCRWLAGDDTADLRRPDRVHYVIDIMPDAILMNTPGDPRSLEVVQVWIDPKHPDAWRHDAEFRAYMVRRGAEHKAILIRNGSKEGLVVFPPSMAGGVWRESVSRALGEGEGASFAPTSALNATL